VPSVNPADRGDPCATLIDLLCGRRNPASLSPGEWATVIATARSANLLGSLGEKLGSAGVRTGCEADRHLAGARQLSERQRRSVRWEAQALHDALAGLGVPIVLLKGAAYAMGGFPNAHGRLFGDIDILVPGESLGAVEVRLMTYGWTPTLDAEYDQRYYRQWMHELPPMVHVRRGSVLDVHHTILPPTARHKPDPRRIIERARPLPGLPFLRVPCVEDLVIHSITHLAHEGELANGLRDLHDIHRLISEHAADATFFSRLGQYTREHGLEEPVALGLRLARRHFGTAVPAHLLAPRRLHGRLARAVGMPDRLYDLALRPRPAADAAVAMQLSGFALYLRAHWLRMPPLLLARHLARKAVRRAFVSVAGGERGDTARTGNGLPR
jgi:hypothetical protein